MPVYHRPHEAPPLNGGQQGLSLKIKKTRSSHPPPAPSPSSNHNRQVTYLPVYSAQNGQYFRLVCVHLLKPRLGRPRVVGAVNSPVTLYPQIVLFISQHRTRQRSNSERESRDTSSK